MNNNVGSGNSVFCFFPTLASTVTLSRLRFLRIKEICSIPEFHPCASNNNYNYFTNSYAPKPFFPDSRLLHFENLFGIAYKILYKTFLKTSVLLKHKQPSIFVLYKEIRFLVKIKESYMRSGL